MRAYAAFLAVIVFAVACGGAPGDGDAAGVGADGSTFGDGPPDVPDGPVGGPDAPTDARPTVTYGNTAPYTASSFSPGYLLGTTIVVSSPMTARRLGVYSHGAGMQARFAIYSDVGGIPGALVGVTAPFTVVTGAQEQPIEAAALAAGTYWFMTEVDAEASFGLDLLGTPQTYIFMEYPFADPPSSLFPFSTYTNGPASFWITGD